jgi:hypothetical protein
VPVSIEADDGTADSPERAAEESRRRLPILGLRHRASTEEEGIAHRLAQQWAVLRDDRRPEPSAISAGPSNFSRAQVPWGLDLAAAWAWRFLIIVLAGYVIARVIGFFAVVTIPIVVALLIAALVIPVGPLHASDSQINRYIDRTQEALTPEADGGSILSRVTEVGAALGHVVAGFFIVLFSTYFFLADGGRIWAWAVRLAPRAAREHVDSSGRVAWVSLTQFVRATVIVALTDAIGIMIVAAILGVPFVLAIGVLVFLGAFVPMVGATVAGTVAVLVALVDQGPITALLMLGGVILIQQIEGHILQPFLMGRWVSVHPLGVIVAIGCGVLVAGIAGALVAVPLAAAVNAVVQHLANFSSPGDDPVEELHEDYEELREEPPTEESVKNE